ncbi:Wound-responsive family protein [Rhynchospora pubera]|uniref:Wound-responsive family protein n=1 Tax=Rhynchospora pubera TaxID=906938 RepID=A0AAV8HED8_9POAL|nr:Wound-responsive family protein [Rhynchospora pubera]
MAYNTRKVSLIVAASISAVEALKDQAGLCRWNYALRLIQQRAKGRFGAFSQATRASSIVERRNLMEDKAKRSEEALRTVILQFSFPILTPSSASVSPQPFYIYKYRTILSSSNQLQNHYNKKKPVSKQIRASSKTQMAPTGRVSLIVAASISAVEALKDQAGLCRWNYALRSVQSRLKQNMGAMSQVRKVSSGIGMEDKAKKSEESLRTVMYLSCWGPN